jgi:uncharacterized membrane protein YvlD (DUF360 family)
MIKFIVRLVLMALVFEFVLPNIPGISFHGQFMTALWMSLGFGIASFLVDAFAVFLAAVLSISTFGLALLILIPLWAIGFWILPAVALKLLADFMPGNLAIHDWVAAALGGLVMLVVNAATGKTNIRKNG